MYIYCTLHIYNIYDVFLYSAFCISCLFSRRYPMDQPLFEPGPSSATTLVISIGGHTQCPGPRNAGKNLGLVAEMEVSLWFNGINWDLYKWDLLGFSQIYWDLLGFIETLDRIQSDSTGFFHRVSGDLMGFDECYDITLFKKIMILHKYCDDITLFRLSTIKSWYMITIFSDNWILENGQLESLPHKWAIGNTCGFSSTPCLITRDTSREVRIIQDSRDPKHGWPLNMVPFFPPFWNGSPLVFWLICHHNKHQFTVHMFFSTFFIMFHHYIQLKSHWINLKIKSHWITLKIQFFRHYKDPMQNHRFSPIFPQQDLGLRFRIVPPRPGIAELLGECDEVLPGWCSW